MIEIKLPWPPTVNTYYRNFNGRMLISKKGRAFAEEVGLICCRERIANKKLEGRLAVEIEAFPPDRRKRDIDNLLKSTLDAVNKAAVFIDDSQIDELSIVRREVSKPGYINLRIGAANG